MRKRILAFLLAAALIGSLLVTAAVAEEGGDAPETAQSGETAESAQTQAEEPETEDGKAAAEEAAGETGEPT